MLVLIPGDTPDEGLAPALYARAEPALNAPGGPGWNREPLGAPTLADARAGVGQGLPGDADCAVRLLRDWYDRGALTRRPTALIALDGTHHRSMDWSVPGRAPLVDPHRPATVDALRAAAPGTLAIFIERYC